MESTKIASATTPPFITDEVLKHIQTGNIKALFPALAQQIHGKRYTYLDSAAATLKPTPVITASHYYYSKLGVNTHRGVYTTSQLATELFEQTRSKLKHFINAVHLEEIVLTYGTTDSFNLIAESYGKTVLSPGDEIILSEMEHHANILPWQKLAEEQELVIKVVRVTERGELDLQHYKELLSPEVKIVSLAHISNTLGTINPIETIIKLAHQNDSVVALDCAQTMVHGGIDVQKLDVDFIAFSSNKMFGPTGVGVLYGKRELLDKMPPYRRGGNGILSVSFEKTIFQGAPQKFEVGTGNIAGVIALGAALDLLTAIGTRTFQTLEQNLLDYATERLRQLPFLNMIGNAAARVPVFTFNINELHPHDVGTLLDEEGIAVRSGHHCAQPIINKYGVDAALRASFCIYNTRDDVDTLITGLKKVVAKLNT